MSATLRQLIAQFNLIQSGESTLGPWNDLPLPDEEQAAVQARADQWCSSLKPNNAIELWLLEQIAVQALRLERCQTDEAVQRDALARSAILTWDDDRRRETEKLARTLQLSPATIASQLRATLAGALWLRDRWIELQAPLDSQTSWNTAQTTRALHLLGLTTTQATTLDLPFAELRSLVRAEIVRLNVLIDGPLADSDRHARSAAARGLGPAVHTALAPLRRLEASIARRLEWLLGRFPASRRLADDAPAKRVGPDAPPYFYKEPQKTDPQPAQTPSLDETPSRTRPEPRRALASPLPSPWLASSHSQGSFMKGIPLPPPPNSRTPATPPRGFPTQPLETLADWAMMSDRLTPSATQQSQGHHKGLRSPDQGGASPREIAR